MRHSRHGVSSLMNTALYISLAAISVSGIYLLSSPIVGQLNDTSVVDSMITSMQEIESTVSTVAAGGNGTQQPLTIGFRDGTLEFDSVRDTITYSLETSADIVSPGTSQEFGNLILSAGASVTVNRTSVDGIRCWQLTNEHIEACIRDIPRNDPDLAFYYNFSGSGQYLSDAGPGVNAVLGSSASQEEADPTRRDGCHLGSCILFTQTEGDHITLTETPAVDGPSRTVSMWIYRVPDETTPALELESSETSGSVSFFVSEDGAITVETNSTTTATADSTVATETWTHVGMATNSTHAMLYSNGSRVLTEQHPGIRLGQPAATVGDSGGAGRLDELAVYNATLSSDELQTRYQASVFARSFLRTDRLLVEYRNTDTGLRLGDPVIRTEINSNKAGSYGFGYTDAPRSGAGLSRGEVLASIQSSDGFTYNLQLRLFSGADFLHTRVIPE